MKYLLLAVIVCAGLSWRLFRKRAVADSGNDALALLLLLAASFLLVMYAFFALWNHRFL
jgi:hypothetical protein